MKVAIICSCAEPGRDGVGDYSLRLAAALVAEGHEARLVAERDAAVIGPNAVNGDRDGVPVLRLPAALSSEQRARSIADALDAFAPDWVIVEFVCWGFADRGVLDPPLSAFIAALSGRRVAIYCHELWLGLERGATLRHRWWGRRQREAILRFLKQLRPALVMTSNAAYSSVLQRYGWTAWIVPLFSNIPLQREGSAKFLSLLEQRAGRPLWSSRGDVVMVAAFGSLYPEWQPQAALHWMAEEARRRNRNVVLITAGRPSARDEAVIAQVAREVRSSATVVSLGEVSADVASGLLQTADVGLPSSDWLLLDKSGVAAAMTAHGLPMLIVRNSVSFRDVHDLVVTHEPSVFRFDAGAPPDFDRLAKARAHAVDTLPQITRQLVRALEDAH